MPDAEPRDPFAPVEASPRGAAALAVVAALLGVVAAFTGLYPVAGPLGMALGALGHVKGSRLGLPAVAVAAVGMIAGMAIGFFLP